MSPASLRATMLQRIARLGEWTIAADIFVTFGVEEPGQDRRHYDRLSVTLSRLNRSGLVEVDKTSIPWAYRISDAGRAELAACFCSATYRQRLAERMRVLQAQRWAEVRGVGVRGNAA
jgi:DNA-binding transcriptional regulator PaaX